MAKKKATKKTVKRKIPTTKAKAKKRLRDPLRDYLKCLRGVAKILEQNAQVIDDWQWKWMSEQLDAIRTFCRSSSLPDALGAAEKVLNSANAKDRTGMLDHVRTIIHELNALKARTNPSSIPGPATAS